MPDNSKQNYEIIELEIPTEVSKERLDKYIGRLDKLNITRNQFQKLASSGMVTLNGNPVKHKFIITGGENIYPVEIEDFLQTHPKIQDVAVIGLPSLRLGEIATAIVKADGTFSVTTSSDIRKPKHNPLWLSA